MRDLLYWQKWRQPYKLIFWLLLVAFIALVGTVLVLQFLGRESLLNWHVLSQESSYTIDYSIFAKGPFNFSITADKKILSELFAGGEMPTTTMATQVLMIIIAVGSMLYLSMVTMFKRFWYLVAMGGFLAFITLLHVESVLLFGWSDTKVLILIFVLLLTPSFYLHAFNSEAGFSKRLWIMAAAMILLGGIIYFYSTTQHPFTNLLSYGILAPYILIILFIISVAHEIIALAINVLTTTEGIGNSTKLRHFLIISFIYLTNILLSYLNLVHYIDWQIFYINPFFLLVISAVLGVWGSRARASLYTGASGLEALWPILYLVIAVVSLSTLVFFMLALNDPILRILGDIIIYAHLGIGIAFLLYVLYNFIPLIEKGYKVHKILYKPSNLPYMSYKLMAIMIIVGLFSMRGFDYPVWYSMGGYNNTKADLVLAEGYLDIAEAYFSNADAYAYHNHKANYSLGMMAYKTEPTKAINYFANAMDQQPTGQAIVNKANLHNSQEDYYKALFTLQEGSDLINDKHHLYNNLALQFEKVKVIDSTSYYYQLAGTKNQQVRNNRIAFGAKYNRPFGKDSLALFNNLDRVGLANAAAIGYIENEPSMVTANHMYDMALLNNWLLSDASQRNESALYIARATIDSTTNNDYKDQLMHSWSLAAYGKGNIAQAIDGLLSLAYNSAIWSDRAKFSLAKIYLQQGSYQQAIDIFLDLNKGHLSLELAVALLENGDPEDGLSFWQQAADSEDDFLSTTAKEIIEVIYAEEPNLNSDRKKYLYARYNRFFIDETAEDQLLKRFENLDLRINLALELAAFYHKFDNPQGATQMLRNIEKLELKSEQYRQYIILNALVNQESENVQRQLVEFDSLFSFENDEYLLENVLNARAGMTLDSISYLQMAQDNPFFPDAILIGTQYFEDDKDAFRSYSFLAKAVQTNPESPRLLRAFIFKALDVGLDQFAENSLYEYGQRFSGQSYLILKSKYEQKIKELERLVEDELLE